MIDVIIPAYNAHKTIYRTLYSICYQTISDKIKVYIINDNSDHDYKDIVNYFKNFINIKEIDLDKNYGPGVAREIGINKSKSKYIMFIDSDDVFASPKAVEIMFNEINKKKLDFCTGRFIECKKDMFIQHRNDEIWLHGKIYRRKFIDDNAIHFNETRSNEDNYYNQCVILSNPKRSYVDEAIYFWMYNENSITRKNNYEYKRTGITSYIDNMISALEYAIKNDKNKILIANKVTSVLYAVYYYYIEYKDKEFLKKSIKLKSMFNKYKKYCLDIDNIKDAQYEYALNTLTKDKIIKSNLTFDKFLNSIGGE